MALQFRGQIGHPEFGFGFIPDPVGHRYNGFHLHAASRTLFTAAPALPDEASIDQHAPPIMMQGRTSSCGGHGTAGAVTTTFAAKGFPLRRPADPRMLYTLARAVDRSEPSTPLQDTGTTPNALVRSIAQWGIALDDEVGSRRRIDDPDYPLWLEEHINDEPKLGELQAANTRPNTGFNLIAYEGEMKRDAVCAAIADGYAVMFAVDAGSDAFQSFNGQGVLGYTGPIPDHWVYGTAYRTVQGKRELFMRNSWGLGLWTPDGCAWCSEDFIIRGMFFPLVANLGL